MKKLYSLWDVYKYPLVLLFIAAILKGTGNFFSDPQILSLFGGGADWLSTLCASMMFMGSYLEKMFPLLFLVRYISKRFEDAFPVLNGVVGYILFNIVMMFYGPFNLPVHQYNTSLGMSWNTVYGSAATVKYPLFVGLTGALVIGWIVSFTYKQSRKRFAYGLFGYINNDVWSLLNASFWSAVFGLGFAFGWSYVLKGIEEMMTYISSDIYNPSNLFFYGMLEQVLSVFGLQDLLHEPFWFGSMGGTWMDNFGKTYIGDVRLWTTFVQMNSSRINYGRFITPHYILNLFAVPSLIIALYSLTTDKLKRRRVTGLMILAILTSVFSGYTVPLNLFLAITAPALFFIHTIGVSILYAALPRLGIMIGYAYTGTLQNALPGNLLSLIPYIPNPNYSSMVIGLLIAGILYFVLYLVIPRVYYRHMTGELLDGRKDEKYTNDVIDALGGTANIRFVHSTFDSITVHLYDPSRMNNAHLIELGAYRIVNTRAGIDLQFGPRSSHLRLKLNEAVQKYLDDRMSKPVVTSSEVKTD
ncbi:MAG: PTS transporter subunit EIIC [Erysipelotrichales bacterium]|nr:PTS transporter subunit EIIC [Erysipelotrichales bacterium]